MAMRENCKFFESRTYATGDTVRKCDLSLAPEAPWKCPDNCEAYTPRLADVNWNHGSLVTPKLSDAPESLGKDDSIAELLSEAEEIVRAAGPAVVKDLEQERAALAKAKRKEKKKQRRKKLLKPDGGPLGKFGKFLRDQRRKGDQ